MWKVWDNVIQLLNQSADVVFVNHLTVRGYWQEGGLGQTVGQVLFFEDHFTQFGTVLALEKGFVVLLVQDFEDHGF